MGQSQGFSHYSIVIDTGNNPQLCDNCIYGITALVKLLKHDRCRKLTNAMRNHFRIASIDAL